MESVFIISKYNSVVLTSKANESYRLDTILNIYI